MAKVQAASTGFPYVSLQKVSLIPVVARWRLMNRSKNMTSALRDLIVGRESSNKMGCMQLVAKYSY